MVERKTRKKFKYLRFDNEGEYTSKDFELTTPNMV